MSVYSCSYWDSCSLNSAYLCHTRVSLQGLKGTSVKKACWANLREAGEPGIQPDPRGQLSSASGYRCHGVFNAKHWNLITFPQEELEIQIILSTLKVMAFESSYLCIFHLEMVLGFFIILEPVKLPTRFLPQVHSRYARWKKQKDFYFEDWIIFHDSFHFLLIWWYTLIFLLYLR